MAGFRKNALEQARLDEGSVQARILNAAELVFAKYGYSGTTTRAIAEEAGVHLPQLHYHWGSKEELWNAVHYELFRRVAEFGGKLFEEVSGGRPEGSFRLILRRFVDFFADNPTLAALMGQSPVADMDRGWTRDVGMPLFNAISGYLESNTDLDFSPAETKMAVFAFVGAFEFFFIRPDLVKIYFEEDTTDLSEEFRDRMAQTLSLLIERFGRADTPQ